MICLYKVCVQSCMAAAEVPEGSAEELGRAGPASECSSQRFHDSLSSSSGLRTSPVLLLKFQLVKVP